jgi:hypothetical protein
MQVHVRTSGGRIWCGTRRLTLEGQWRTTTWSATALVWVFLS